MVFVGISKVFSTIGKHQFETIDAFWEELMEKYQITELVGLGYNWTEDSIEYVIGLKEGEIENANCTVILPDEGWVTVQGKTTDLEHIYDKIWSEGALRYEIEIFSNNNECEIKYYR